jgi:hypothetical protein
LLLLRVDSRVKGRMAAARVAKAPKTSYLTAAPAPTTPSPTSSGGKNGGKSKGKEQTDEPTSNSRAYCRANYADFLFGQYRRANAVGTLYNLAVAGRFVDFNDDSQTCTNVVIPTCTTLYHSTCSVSSTSATSILNVPIDMRFFASVEHDSNSCCMAKSCAAVYLDTEPATLLAGDSFSYTVSF